MIDTDEDESAEARFYTFLYASPHLSLRDVPAFGSMEWAMLPDDDPRQWAAVVRAALGWWRLGDDLDDLAERATAQAHVEASHAVSAAMGDAGLFTGYRPTLRELRARRDWCGARGRHVDRDAAWDWGPNPTKPEA